MEPTGFKRKLSAILSADVAGYSRLMGDNEEETVRTLNNYKAFIFELIEKHNGRLVDSPGDNLLAEFASVVDAVRCAVRIQKDLKERNEGLPADRRMEFRIGINTGDVIQDGDRIYGNGVNVAARIESLADPGGICISHTGYDQVKTKLDLGFEYSGKYSVKNISEPVSVYRVIMDSGSEGKMIEENKNNKNTPGKIAAFIIIILIIAAGLYGWFLYTGQSGKTDPVPDKPEPVSAADNVEKAPKTIAVLPFEDISREKDQEYFVDGLSEEILNSLAKIPGLTVIARTSSFSFKDTGNTIQEIARLLGVNHILKGSVRKDGNALRIRVQLINGNDGTQLLSETYDRELRDVLTIQKDIATAVADELKITFGIDRSFQLLNDTDNEEAMALFFKAMGQSGNLEYAQALETVNNVIELDPDYAAAWALKGRIHSLYAQEISPDKVTSELYYGLKAVQRAIDLEPGFGFAYTTLGHIRSSMGNFIEAESAYENVKELTSGPIVSVEYLLHLSKLGYFKKCSEILEKMLFRRDPLIQGAYVLNLGCLGDMERARAEYKHGKEMFGENWIYGDFNIIWLQLDNQDGLSIPEIPMFDPIWSMGKDNIGAPEEGIRQLRQVYSSDDNLSSNDFLIIACWAAYFEEQELALSAMEKSVRLQTTGLYFIWTPLMHEVRQLPRFKEFLREMNLVEYWRRYGWPDLCIPLENGDFECD